MTFTTDQLRNSIQRGDCIEVMQAIPSRSVDFILTDPPLSRPLLPIGVA